MADAQTQSKAEKLAAAKKKLREFQNNQKKKVAQVVVSKDEPLLTSSKSNIVEPASIGYSATTILESDSVGSFAAVLAPSTVTVSYPPRVGSENPSTSLFVESTPSNELYKYVDSISQSETIASGVDVISVSSCTTSVSEPISHSVEFPQTSSSVVSINILENDNGDTDQRSQFPILNLFSGEPTNKSYVTDSFFDGISSLPTGIRSSDVNESLKDQAKPMEPFVNVFRADVENGAIFHDEITNDVSDKPESVTSTVDSASDYIRNLSFAVSTQDGIEQPSFDISELERKNEELVSALVLEQKRCDDLSSDLMNYKLKVNDYSNKLKEKDRTFVEFENQMKMHIAALDMVSNEKFSLERELEQMKSIVNEKDRRIQLLEADVNVLKNCHKDNEELNENYTVVFQENLRHKEKLKTLEEKIVELTNMLEGKSQICADLKNQIQKYELDISAKVTQAYEDKDDTEYRNKYEKMSEQCKLLEQTVLELQNQICSLTYERDQTNNYYKNCLAADRENAVLKIEELEKENSFLQEKLSSKTEHIEALEKQLQNKNKYEIVDTANEDLAQDLKSTLQEKEIEIQNLNYALKNSKDEEAALQMQILSLSNEYTRLNQERADVEKLQASFESDKVAASQAISQNNKLKKEYESLQHAFVALNQTNAEVVKKLELEKLLNEELQNQIKEIGSGNITEKLSEVPEKYRNTEPADHPGDKKFDELADMKSMMMLQEKFKEVVNKMADLADEKHQLEHLVLQLQSETETIGEYVTLYQKQRYLLHRKAEERERHVAHIIQEKEYLYNKWLELNNYIQSLPPHVRNTVGSIGEEYEKMKPLQSNYKTTTEVSDDVLHPTSCYCSGRRVMTV